jgi:hypothetical protein
MRDVVAAVAVASMILVGLVGLVMVTRPRFFVARYVKMTTAQAPRRERPIQDDLAKVKPGDVVFWRFLGCLWLAFVVFFIVKVGLDLLHGT